MKKYSSEDINELALALSKAQREITPAIKDTTNPFFKSKYADLNSIWSVCREPLSRNQLSVTQIMDYDGDKIVLITILMHSSGQFVNSFLPIFMQKQDAQAFGSACTYAKRYALSAICGISCDADDDGNMATAAAKNYVRQPIKICPSKATSLVFLLKDVGIDYYNYIEKFIKTEYTCSSFNDLSIEQFEILTKSANEQLEVAKSK